MGEMIEKLNTPKSIPNNLNNMFDDVTYIT